MMLIDDDILHVAVLSAKTCTNVNNLIEVTVKNEQIFYTSELYVGLIRLD